MSPAANTATTPGDDAAVDRSSFFSRPLAIGAQHQRGMQRAGRLGDVVDIERLAGDVLQRAVVALRGMDLAFHSASTSTAWPGRGDAQLEPAQEVFGGLQAIGGAAAPIVDRLELGLDGGDRRPQSRPSCSAASTAVARLGVAAMPPKAMRASSMRPDLIRRR